MQKFLSCLILLLGAAMLAQAQQDNVRSRSLLLGPDTIQLDSMVIFKGTLQISENGRPLLEGTDYFVDYRRSAIHGTNTIRNVQAEYRVMMLDISKPYSKKDRKLLHPEYHVTQNPFLYSSSEQREELFSKDGLKMNGSLSRGLSFGNNQDVVLNSNLNLQLSGRLQNDIDVLAAISDENNPIQPEGNTQQLQDFDRVYIQLSKNRTKLTVGDFEMVRPNGSYFMNYYKKSRGGQFTTAIPVAKRGELRLGGEGAISRGRFARNIINGVEGNQGPYRLNGSNGETFIIIISGTEAIYLDGERLTRGEQNDYIIDYNSGELTFMPKRVITQYSRIVAEFQYSDRNFARSVFHFNTEYEEKKFRIRANYFTEQDDKDQPFLQNLTDSNKRLLASVGDDLAAALAPSETATRVFSRNKILYRKIDSAGFGSIFVFTDDPASDTVFYEVRFSFVGNGNGDYIQAQSSANGRVFQWLAPVAGQRQGNYAPVVQLVSPKRLQMLTLGTDLKLIKNTTVSVEGARSQYDKNLYSGFDKADDAGYGLRLAANNVIPLQDKQEDFWNIRTEAGYEHVDKNFRYVERYRNVEFDRTWNRLLVNQPNQDTGYEENIVSLRTSLNRSSIGSIFYQAGYYSRAAKFTGTQSFLGSALRFRKNVLAAEAEWIDTKNKNALPAVTNETRRYRLDCGRELFIILAGIRYDTEKSNFRRGNDTLLPGSFSYDQYTFYINNLDSTQLRYRLEYSQREDFQPQHTDYRSATIGKNFTAGTDWTQKNLNRLSANFTYREFIVKDTAFTKLQPEKTILARVEYDYAFIKRVFSANTYYQVGSGNELRRDFQYVEVPTGQGVYVWRDFNNDDKQTLNEFVPASFAERNQANYIKVFLPTNSSIRTNSNQFSQTLNINPAAVWYNKTGLKKALARWYNQTALRLERKTTALDNEDFLNPFILSLSDSQIISTSSLIRNSLFFNRSDPKFGFDLSYSDNRSKNFLTNGFDTRKRQEQGSNIRWNFSSDWGITLGYTNGRRLYFSDFFNGNNYSYYFNEVKPRLIYQFTQNLRITLVFSYFEGVNNAEFGSQVGSSRETGTELRYNIARQGVINAKFSYFKVAFNGDIGSPLGYDMLQGFTIGENMLWNLNYQQRLGNNLQLNLNYDGRKSEGQDIIHIGRMEARYLF